MKTDSIRKVAIIFAIFGILAILYSLAALIAAIAAKQMNLILLIDLLLTASMPWIMFAFADATYDALTTRRLSKEDQEVLDNYTDHR